MDRNLRIRSLVMLVAILPGLMDIEPLAKPMGSVDDAALLMLASQALVLGPEALAVTRSGSGPARLAPSLANGTQASEIRAYMKWIEQECAGQRATLTTTTSGETLQASLAELDAACQQQLADLESQARRLDRARKRGKGFQNFWRRIARGTGEVVKVLVVKVPKFVYQEGIKPAGTILIKDVLPGTLNEVLQTALTGGVRLRGKALKDLARRIFRRRLQRAGEDLATEKVTRLVAGRRQRASTRPLAAEEQPPASAAIPAEELEELFSTGEKVIEVKITEADLVNPSNASLWAHRMAGQTDNPNWCGDDLSDGGPATRLKMWIRFNLDTGKVEGEVGASFGCGTDCNEPGEFVKGRLDGVITHGWVRPDGLGGWEWGGELDSEASLSAEQSCGKLIHQDTGVVEDFRIRGSTSMKLTGALEGNSQGVPGSPGPWFMLRAPTVDMPEEASYMGYSIGCYRPACPLPEQFPPPPG